MAENRLITTRGAAADAARPAHLLDHPRPAARRLGRGDRPVRHLARRHRAQRLRAQARGAGGGALRRPAGGQCQARRGRAVPAHHRRQHPGPRRLLAPRLDLRLRQPRLLRMVRAHAARSSSARRMEEIFGAGAARGPPRADRRRARRRAAVVRDRGAGAANGEWAHEWVHFIPDRQGDEVRGFFVMATDVTELKNAELRLKLANQDLIDASRRAEAATVAKSAFLANMSHEIRTPMNAIIGLTHLLRRDTREPTQRERLGKIADAAHHLLAVINDILDLSKIESGKLKLEAADFSVDALLMRACALVADTRAGQGPGAGDRHRRPAADAARRRRPGCRRRCSTCSATPSSSPPAARSRCMRVLVERSAESMLGALLGARHRHRHRRRQARRPVQRLRAGRQLDHAPLRRHRPRPVDHPPARGADGRRGRASRARRASAARFWFSARLGHARDAGVVRRSPWPLGSRCLLADDLPEAREALLHMLRQVGLRGRRGRERRAGARPGRRRRRRAARRTRSPSSTG